ncbi:recombinase family protein [Serratia marcescens]
MNGQRIGYIRVSHFDQDPEPQLEHLRVDNVFIDNASNKDVQRPELDALFSTVRNGDTVVVHSMDRFARNLNDLQRQVHRLADKGVTIEFVKESLTFTGKDSSADKLMFSVMGAFAEFERALVRERQREGIALARLQGAYRGRKKLLSSECSGQEKLATVLCSNQNNRSDSFGVRPPL